MMTEKIPVAPIQKAVNRSDEKEEKANKIIRRYTLISSGAALIPYDFVDIITSTVTQTMMVKELCQLYQVAYSSKMVNVAFWSVIGSVVTKAITEVVGTILNNSSDKGQFDLTGAAVAGIYTASVGEFYKIHLREGGTLENVNFSDFTDFFISEVREGDLSISTFTNPTALMEHLNV